MNARSQMVGAACSWGPSCSALYSICTAADCKGRVLAAVYEANLEKMCKLSCIEVIMSVWVQMRLPGRALAHLPLGPAYGKSSAIKCHEPFALPPSAHPLVTRSGSDRPSCMIAMLCSLP